MNSDHSCDLYLMEGIKLLMLLNVLDLKQKQDRGEDVLIFVWLLFARDTSETPVQFVKNHLNTLGDIGGIEQVNIHFFLHRNKLVVVLSNLSISIYVRLYRSFMVTIMNLWTIIVCPSAP